MYVTGAGMDLPFLLPVLSWLLVFLVSVRSNQTMTNAFIYLLT